MTSKSIFHSKAWPMRLVGHSPRYVCGFWHNCRTGARKFPLKLFAQHLPAEGTKREQKNLSLSAILFLAILETGLFPGHIAIPLICLGLSRTREQISPISYSPSNSTLRKYLSKSAPFVGFMASQSEGPPPHKSRCMSLGKDIALHFTNIKS